MRIALASLAALSLLIVGCTEGPAPDVVAASAVASGAGTCRNNVVEAPEECDDGNNTNGDGCDSNCTTTRCGNNVVSPGEECDEGGVDTDSCDFNCTFRECGDSYI